MQFYIVTGGHRNAKLASTEILKKDGSTSWQTVASLPSARYGLRGVSLPNGHFMVSGDDGQYCQTWNFNILNSLCREVNSSHTLLYSIYWNYNNGVYFHSKMYKYMVTGHNT